MPPIRLSDDAVEMLANYNWPGNIRQLKNITEQISVIESERAITAELLKTYLPDYSGSNLPAIAKGSEATDFNERDLLYKVLFDMRKDITDLKKLVIELLQTGNETISNDDKRKIIDRLYREITPTVEGLVTEPYRVEKSTSNFEREDNFANNYEVHTEVEESLSLEDRERELIKKALEKHRGKRKYAAQDLGISERTLYRKIKEFEL